MGNFKEDIARIKAFVFDVDGVFTDGKITITPDNQFVRAYDSKDGFAVKTLTAKGYKVAIITGGKGDSLTFRFNQLGIKDIYIDCFEKLDAMNGFMKRHGLEYEDILYMGDDIPDLEPMMKVGISSCPADAVNDVKKMARYVSGYNGGNGCVRDVIEQVLRAQDNWCVDEFGNTITSA